MRPWNGNEMKRNETKNSENRQQSRYSHHTTTNYYENINKSNLFSSTPIVLMTRDYNKSTASARVGLYDIYSEYVSTVVVQPNKNSQQQLSNFYSTGHLILKQVHLLLEQRFRPSLPRPMSLAKFPATRGETYWPLAVSKPMKTKTTVARQITHHFMNHLCPSSPDHWHRVASQI